MKKKGFTLVELLAVIVILAIIALITVPIVLKTISNSEVQAEKQSIDGYARVIEEDKANEGMLHPGQKYEMYITQPDGTKKLKDYDYKGNKVFCTNQYFDEKDKLVLENCYVNDKEITDPEQRAKKNFYNYINGKVEPIPKSNNNTNSEQSNNTSTNTTYKEYKVGDEVILTKHGNETYHVIADSPSNQDYVTLLKDQPLTVNEINANKIGNDNVNHVNKNSYSYVGTAYDYGDSNHSGGIAYYSSTTCGYVTPGDNNSYIETGCSTSYNSSDIKHVVDNWSSSKFGKSDLKEANNYRARLVTKEELLTNLGYSFTEVCTGSCYQSVDTSMVPNWVYNSQFWYWTMSQYEDYSTKVWGVGLGLFYPDLNGSYGGVYLGTVRPVINIYKSEI